MKGFRPYLISFFVTVTVASIGFFAAAQYSLRVSKENYLAGLRENSTFGCSTAGLTKSEVFFIGDSHSYAGWNFNIASQLMGTSSISACMMGALYLETLPAIMQKFKENNGYPRRLVYGTSLWQFTDRKGKQDQLAQHNNLLNAFRSRYNLSAANDMIGHARMWRKNPEASPAQMLQRNLLTHSIKVESTQESSATSLMERESTESKLLWGENQRNIVFEANIKGKIDEFCNLINREGIILYVIDIPESPYMLAKYKKEDLLTYQRILQHFRQCSKNIVTDGIASYGLGNRHFLNRSMLDNFPYESLQDTSRVSLAYLYDLDHMNLIGATKFTSIAVKRLGLSSGKPSS
jgi:hypothetical protein